LPARLRIERLIAGQSSDIAHGFVQFAEVFVRASLRIGELTGELEKANR
jgi:hypothetical protein